LPIELPGAATELAQPVVGWAAIGGRVTPQVPIAARVIP